MMRAIIWTAVSTKIQAADDKMSLPEQERLAREFAASQNATIVDVLSVPGHSRSETDVLSLFEDYAASGIDAYHRLRRHWQNNDFDLLIAFHPNRLGRSFSIQSFVLENVVKNGRRAYLIQGGWVDAANIDFVIATSGISAKSEIKHRVAMSEAGTKRRMQHGLHTRRPAFTHRTLRDERGRAVRLEVREELRRLFDDMAEVLLSGKGYHKMVTLLYQRGHLNPDTKRPLAPATLYRAYHNPYTWGISAIGFYSKYGCWAFDESLPLPPGVTVDRHPNPPIPTVWSGALAAAIQSELKRRANLTSGRSWANYHLTGLLRCAVCGRRMAIGWSGADYSKRYWCCPKFKSTILETYTYPCTNRKSITDARAKAQIIAFLERARALHLPDLQSLAAPNAQLPDYRANLAALAAEIAAAEARLDALILQRADYPAAAQARATTLITELSAHLDNLRIEQARLQLLIDSDSARETRYNALHELFSFRSIFEAEPVLVNRLLNDALGSARFICLKGEIIDVG